MENNGIKNGLFMGVTSILLSMILYFVNPRLMLGGSIAMIASIIITIFFMYKAGKDERHENGGYLSFGQGLKVTFLTSVIGYLLAIIFSFILMKFIDPSLTVLQAEMAMEQAESMAGMFGAPEDAIEEMKDKMEDQDFSPSIGNSLMGYAGSLFFGFIIALIVSAIVKKDDPSNV